MDFTGKTAIVTGGSRGIGRAVCLELARGGANVVLCYAGNEDAARETVSSCENLGAKALAVRCDVSDAGQVQAMADAALASFGRIDILVNNAGTQRRNDSVNFTDEDWDFVCTVNQKSVFVLCREVGRHMVKNGKGKIINFASLLSFQGGLRVPAYAASKGAVMQFTKSLANEWAAHGVNVNCIAPGYFDTEMNTALINDPVRNEQISVRIPAGRWGKPEDLAGTAIYLASSASDYVNGVTIPVDGGWLGR